MNIAIIPARGGSKRIPNKNIKLFHGKPLITYSIAAAQESGMFDRIIVSTDSAEVAAIAQQSGAEIPFLRPAHLSDDYTGTTPVIRHALNELKQQNYHVEYCCCIYATTPLLTAQALSKAGNTLLNDTNLNFVFSATRFAFPIQRALLQSSNGGVVPFDPLSIAMRSQDLAPTYHDAGQFYWGKAEAFLDPKASVFSEQSRMHLLPDYMVADIDTVEDWERAEVMYSLLKQQGEL